MEAQYLEVTSPDGAVLGVERVGAGPPLVLVHGSTADRSRWAPVRAALAASYTLYLLDRRGRGASLTEPAGRYALSREVNDARALIDHIGGPVYYLGHSYGALIGVDILPSGANIAKALLYEPPFDAEGHHVFPAGFIARYAELIGAERRDEALDLFYRDVIGVDPEPLHSLPIWQARRLAAHTLVREARMAETYLPDKAALRNVAVPTLVLTGSESPPVFGAAARLVVDALPHGHLVTAPGQGHAMIDADPPGFVDIVRGFLC